MCAVVGGNWKCNPASAAKLPELVANIEACDTSKCDVYVCPSPLHVSMVSFTKGAKIAPQNMNFAGCGAYTGEMAADQMVDMGIEWVLMGHSERRGEFGLPTPAESNELLATKCAYALEKGLKVIFCIGESLPIREKGIGAVVAECIKQLEQIKGLLDPAKVVIAYEPVWAIGTGVTASPEQAQETHAAIRKWIADTVSPDGNATRLPHHRQLSRSSFGVAESDGPVRSLSWGSRQGHPHPVRRLGECEERARPLGAAGHRWLPRWRRIAQARVC